MTTGINKIGLWVMGFLLLGYAFLSKGFAYLGYPPFFIGELTLGIVMLAILLAGPNLAFLRAPLSWFIIVFILWQAIILATGPRASLVLILRDSVIWGYAIFAFVVPALLLRSGSIHPTLEWYGRWLPWFVIWAPIGYLVSVKLGNVAIPTFPGSHVKVFNLKPGDFGVHLAGAAAFLALGLHRTFPLRDLKTVAYKELIWWGMLASGVIVNGSRNRGGMLSVFAALTVVTVLRPNNRLRNILLPALIIVVLFVAFDVRVPLGAGREISIDQITSNVESIFVGSKKRSLSGTSKWRIRWWKEIIDETIYGDNFWLGVGYGPSLAKVNGFADKTGNRSPHNGHLTILARSGVPGLFLWVLMLGALYLSLFKCYLSAQQHDDRILANLNIWVMAYLTAFIVNASFDVYLEGPQGGIWFWCLVGFAVALTYSQKVRSKQMQVHMLAGYPAVS